MNKFSLRTVNYPLKLYSKFKDPVRPKFGLQGKALFSSTRYRLDGSGDSNIEESILNDLKKVRLDQIRVNDGRSTDFRNLKTTDKKGGNGNKTRQWLGIGAFVTLCSGSYYYLLRKKSRLEVEKIAESNRQLLDGQFQLTDFNGQKFTQDDLLGKFSIIYFGFTHCPDVCPTELDRLTVWLKKLEKKRGIKPNAIFVTCDPIRDTPDVLKRYLKDFHPSIIGLTGTYDQIKDMCKNFKVFFSTPRNVSPQEDYIVDHSAFFYLLDPEGQFVEALGTIYEDKDGLERIEKHIDAYVPKAERERRMSKWYSFLYK
ncbi:hypothetical protein KAFR_0F02380 [Kazachstania africana CBS 2517]|uniref:Thioredoxin domain-containing protein n=1 Tax=Kazachstania africana (strain ATCC 22294 / BCRC 22015 / CBS 2517 / CECT 1963 / NBRC 1671 / NRRL Y-8276) TaxID=1071382 RepID=H2AWT5_KAZAF|nr:hypothetical protein KAFR_0F02380 [Kazachstania africana CBS 2517]CCF58835.1 hypothetical protein KAFR_0F02380 [Kazachstania africana CBS 2517]